VCCPTGINKHQYKSRILNGFGRGNQLLETGRTDDLFQFDVQPIQAIQSVEPIVPVGDWTIHKIDNIQTRELDAMVWFFGARLDGRSPNGRLSLIVVW
jgi:hypothetical protein